MTRTVLRVRMRANELKKNKTLDPIQVNDKVDPYHLGSLTSMDSGSASKVVGEITHPKGMFQVISAVN